jgi:hypothetical protein
MAISVPTLKRERAQTVSYDEFLSKFKFRSDHHVTVCGPTGCGKSVLLVETIIPRCPYCVYFDTKPKDKTTETALSSKDWGWTDDPQEIHPWVHKKWVVGIKNFSDPDYVRIAHKQLFSGTLNRLFSESGWAMLVDEGRYVCDPEYLGLRAKIAQYYIQGRSDRKRVILATQRPSWVPQEAFDQASHLFFFNDDDLRNIDRMAEAAGASRRHFKEIIPQLEITEDEGGQFLYYNRLTKQSLISKVEI